MGKRLYHVVNTVIKPKYGTGRNTFAELCGVQPPTVSVWFNEKRFRGDVLAKMELPLIKEGVNPDFITGKVNTMELREEEPPENKTEKLLADILDVVKDIRRRLPPILDDKP